MFQQLLNSMMALRFQRGLDLNTRTIRTLGYLLIFAVGNYDVLFGIFTTISLIPFNSNPFVNYYSEMNCNFSFSFLLFASFRIFGIEMQFGKQTAEYSWSFDKSRHWNCILNWGKKHEPIMR